MKKIILFSLVLTAMTALNSCSKSNELTPKTGNINSGYLLPKGTLLSAEDRDAIDKRLTEYNDATGL
jgi:outer membrane protein assembly factor BamE (lipoprotein component of BamABCDE complex)